MKEYTHAVSYIGTTVHSLRAFIDYYAEASVHVPVANVIIDRARTSFFAQGTARALVANRRPMITYTIKERRPP